MQNEQNPAASLQYLEGTLERLTYQNDENGYTVARLIPKGKTYEVTVVGTLTGVNVGEMLHLEGVWTSHPQYGRQFEVRTFSVHYPATVEGLRKYLGSGLVHGVGPVTAGRIVDYFGLQILDIIESQPNRLREVPGIGQRRAETIALAWEEQKQIKEIMMFLQGHGVSTSLAVRIYKQYGQDSINVVRSNPYQLARDVFGIGFRTADKIARQMGISLSAPARLQAGLLYTLSTLSDEGHCFAYRDQLLDEAVRLLEVARGACEEQLETLIRQEELFAEDPAALLKPLEALRAAAPGKQPVSPIKAPLASRPPEAVVPQPGSGETARIPAAPAASPVPEPGGDRADRQPANGGAANNQTPPGPGLDGKPLQSGLEGQAVYLPPFFLAERGVTSRLRRIQLARRDRLAAFQAVDWERAFAWLDGQIPIRLTEQQKEAVRMALTSKVSILTGGPGTGKSTITGSIIRLLQARKHSVLLAAPTGRAAKRLSEATGLEGKTIHRLLEFKPGAGGPFLRDQKNPLDADLIIIDETSMVDILLMNHLLGAIDQGSHLLLVGDVDQLPSVGPGNVLRDLIASSVIPVTWLDTIFRQAEDSFIIVNAHRINQGQMPSISRQARDFFLFPEKDPLKAADWVIDLVTQRVPARFGFNPTSDIQVLSPMHRGSVGVSELNLRLQEKLNPPQPGKAEYRQGHRVFREGDRVMQIRNDYERQVFNGDMGRIIQLDLEESVALIDFEGRPVQAEFSQLDELVHAYAVSIHKSQGSEFPVVVIPLLNQHYMMLQRNLLYTAVTRARKLVVLVGSRQAIAMAVRNNRIASRNTRLAARLQIYTPPKDSNQYQA